MKKGLIWVNKSGFSSGKCEEALTWVNNFRIRADKGQ